MKLVSFFVALVVVLLIVNAAPSAQQSDLSSLQFGKLSISKTGVLSINGQSLQYILVPEDKYPAELSGMALVDISAQIYVARFFEPSGIGVEGFFDVCFQVKGKEITTALVQNAGSLERIGGVADGVIDVEALLIREAWGKRQPQQAALPAAVHPFGYVEEGSRDQLAAAQDADSTGLLHNE